MLHWLQRVEIVVGWASVFLAAPVSLIFAWIGWIRADRHGKHGWRTKALHGALVLVSLAATCYAVSLGLQWWTRMQESPTQRVFLDWVCIMGGLFCLSGCWSPRLGKAEHEFLPPVPHSSVCFCSCSPLLLRTCRKYNLIQLQVLAHDPDVFISAA